LQYSDILTKRHVTGVWTRPDGSTVAAVDRKRPESDLSDADLVPPERNGLPTDVVEADFQLETDPYDATAHPYPDRRGRFEPLLGGIQIQADGSEGVGTVGSPLLETADGEAVVLTNEHVVGDSEPGDAVFQPDSDGEQIGTLHSRTHAYDDATAGDEDREPAPADAALISVGRSEWSDDLLGIESPTGWGEAAEYDDVRKSGRTTGVTEGGIVFGLDAELNVKIGEDEAAEAIRRPVGPCLVSTLTTAGGDSGSLWVREGDGAAVGLHFAGGSGVAAAIPASAVQDALGGLGFVDTRQYWRWGRVVRRLGGLLRPE